MAVIILYWMTLLVSSKVAIGITQIPACVEAVPVDGYTSVTNCLDCPGSDISMPKGPYTPQQCATICNQNPLCKAFTVTSTSGQTNRPDLMGCYIKTACPSQQPQNLIRLWSYIKAIMLAKRNKVGQSSKEISPEAMDIDKLVMHEMGYNQELSRSLGSFMNFAFGFTEVAVLASLVSVFGVAMNAGGPPMIIWGWVVGSICTIIVSLSMAEICSAYPSAGSVYHWSGQLASKKWAPLASYITGWFNFLGNGAGDASFASSWALMVSGALMASIGRSLTPEQQVGVSIAVVFVWSILNILRIENVGWLNNLAAALQILSLLGIGIAVLAATPSRNSASFVFTETYNGTGFASWGYVVCLGMLTTLFSFSGYEASAHMAEETQGAAKSAPRGIIFTCLATAIGGFIFILPMLFSMQSSVEDSLNGTTTVVAIDIFLYSCGDIAGAFLAWLVVVNLFMAGTSSVTVTGRITYALLRDHAFPFSKYLSGVTGRFKTPAKAIMFVFVFDAIILLLPLTDRANGSLALTAVTQLTSIGFQISYGIPILLRITSARNNFNAAGASQGLGTFTLGKLAIPLGLISCLWLFGTSTFFFFPGTYPVTASNMNYVIVVFGLIVIIGTIYWFIRGRHHFVGPVRSRHDEHNGIAVQNPGYNSFSKAETIPRSMENQSDRIIIDETEIK